MPKLVSMKLDTKERKKMREPSVLADGPVYPWGLQLNLNEDVLDKLDVDDGAMPKIGSEVLVAAKAKVTGVHSHDRESGKQRSVELQITELGLGEAGSKSTNAQRAKDLYKA